jgi:hypothetical protein
MMPIFKGNFSCKEDVEEQFATKIDGTILYAAYDSPAYEGYAYVVLLVDGELYDVEASHCSCNGLEECWSPQKSSIKAIKMYSSSLIPFPDSKEIQEIENYINGGKSISSDKDHAIKFATLHLETAKTFLDTITEDEYDYNRAKEVVQQAIDKTKYLN